jgi:PleD family two-component response regulator
VAADKSIAKSVLVVDDDPLFARLVEKALEPAGIRCICVRSAEEALKLTADEAPRGVVTDGLLPGIRGDELALRLRRAYPRERLPIVFVSAFFRDMKSRLHLTRTCQVDVVLHKPIGIEDLRRAFARLPGLAPPALPVLAPATEGLELSMTSAVEMIADYIQAATEKVTAMQSALEQLGTAGHETARGVLKVEAHRFRGSGGSYGLPEVSRLGAQLEALLDAEPAGQVSPATRARLTGLVEALGNKVSRAGAGTPAGEVVIAQGMPLRLLVIDGPGDLALSCSEAAAKGQPITFVSDPAAAQEAAAADPPDVAFVAADRPEFDGLWAAQLLRGSGVRPVVVMAKSGTMEERLKAQALGVEGYLHRLPDAAALWRVAAEYARPAPGGKVLAVDSDPASLAELAQALAQHRLDVEPCTDPAAFFEAMQRANPDLVMVTAELPWLTGLDLVRALRADAKHRRVPAIILSGSGEPKDRIAAFAAGADDFVQVPYVADELVARSLVLMARHAREVRAAVTDSVTGTFRTAYLLEACDRALHLARRGRPLALLVFDADVEAARPVVGALAVEESVTAIASRLSHAFRVSDVVARLGDGMFAVLLHDVAKENAERLLQSNLESFRPSALSPGLSVRVRGALATFPEVSGGAEALLDAALAGLALPA